MPVLSSNPATSSTAQDIIKDALYEINALAAGEEIGSDDAAFCMRKLNRLFDTFNAREAVIFNVNFTNYQLQTNHQPHTIGPGGDFDTDPKPRPVKIVAANLILQPGVPAVNIPITIRDDAWWANNRVQGLASTYPTDLYYSPDWPLGACNFWPVPQTAYQVQLETWNEFTQVTALTDVISYPQGYWDAIVYTLALTLCPAFEKPANPILVAAQMKAMAAIIGNNSAPLRMDLNDAGLPTGRSVSRGHWDWRTGGIRGGS